MTTVVKQLRQVVGIDKVKIKNFRKGLFQLVPKAGKQMSPGAVWDAVIKAGFTPRKLVTPNHEYTKRPSS